MKKNKILIVDDDKSSQDLMATILQKNYEIKVANNGKIALEILDIYTIDLILLDINMPVMDGYEFAKVLKKTKKLKHIPFIFLTTKNSEDSIVEGFNLGAKDFISKPVKKEELKLRIKTQLKISKLQNKLLYKINLIKTKNEIILKQERLSAMAEMLDAVAHQWKQPLSIILLNIEQIVMEFNYDALTKDSANNLLEHIKKQSHHLIDTLDDFRSFFRNDKEIIPFSYYDMIESVKDLIKTEFIKENINFENKVDKTIMIGASKSEFRHVYINLIANSKFAFNDNNIKNKKITISNYTDEDYNYFTFEDNAGGIKEEIIKDIFNLNVSGRKEKGGTGTGLYLSKIIVEKYNGTISVENKNKGACFTIKLPKLKELSSNS